MSHIRLPSAVLSVLLLSPSIAPAGARAGTDPPNIVFVFTDDQRYDALGFLHPVLETPSLDELAADGFLFPNAFVTTPICPSSRATVLTGLHESTHGFTFATPPLALDLLLESYPRLLRDAGFTTGFVGKNGAQLDDPSLELLFDWFAAVDRNPYIQVREGEMIHATDFTAKKAVKFMETASEPFMLTVWFNAPHAEDSDPAQFIPPERYDNLYAGIDFPDPPTSDPEFFASQPEFLQGSFNRVRWHWRWTPELYDMMMSRYLAMITGIDDAVAEIVAGLEDTGVRNRTVIIFMSDNGYFIGERGFAGKWLAHEPSIRTPLLVHDPRAQLAGKGQIIPLLVLNIDIPETILELAEVEIPSTMQGASLVPLLEGTVPSWREDFFVEHSFTHPPNNDIPRHESLRTTRFKYIHYIDEDFEELYELLVDPYEELNLVDDPSYFDDLEALRERTRELKELYSDALFQDGFETGDTTQWTADSP